MNFIVGFIIVLSFVISGLGLFYHNDNSSIDTKNIFGNEVQLYGKGVYANDSYFFAPVFRGSDLTILLVGIPLLVISFINYKNKQNLKSKIFLVSVLGIFLYQTTSITFGAFYNSLHLIYIFLFFLCLCSILILLAELYESRKKLEFKASFKSFGLKIMLGITGIALIVAWIPDIIKSIIDMRPPIGLEVYHTSITNILDIGVIGPAALIALYLVHKKNIFGMILAEMILILGAYIGVMVVSQSYFQYSSGIELPIAVILTKALSFVILGFFSAYFAIKIYKNINIVNYSK